MALGLGGERMGKAAENERQLRATFWNNLAAAFALGGVISPYFYFMRTPSLTSMQLGSLLGSPGLYAIGVSVFVAFSACRVCRIWAGNEAAKIQD
jgi:hypothetical protein